MPAIITTDMIKRSLADPNLAGSLMNLVARKTKSSKGKKTKIKGGTIAGIIIAIIVIIIVVLVILFILRKRQQKKKLQGAGQQQGLTTGYP